MLEKMINDPWRERVRTHKVSFETTARLVEVGNALQWRQPAWQSFMSLEQDAAKWNAILHAYIKEQGIALFIQRTVPEFLSKRMVDGLQSASRSVGCWSVMDNALFIRSGQPEHEMLHVTLHELAHVFGQGYIHNIPTYCAEEFSAEVSARIVGNWMIGMPVMTYETWNYLKNYTSDFQQAFLSQVKSIAYRVDMLIEDMEDMYERHARGCL